jgi:type II secretion system protein H
MVAFYRNSKQSVQQGFTLLEILVVLIIISVIATMVVVTAFPSPAQILLRDAEHLAQQLEYAQQESRATGLNIEWRLTQNGFAFYEMPPVRIRSISQLVRANEGSSNSTDGSAATVAQSEPVLIDQPDLKAGDWMSDQVTVTVNQRVGLSLYASDGRVVDRTSLTQDQSELDQLLRDQSNRSLLIAKRLPAPIFEIELKSGDNRVILTSDSLGRVDFELQESKQ